MVEATAIVSTCHFFGQNIIYKGVDIFLGMNKERYDRIIYKYVRIYMASTAEV